MTPGGLTRCLINEQILTEDNALRAANDAAAAKRPYVSFLVAEGLASAQQIAVAASQEFGVPLLDLDTMDLEQAPHDGGPDEARRPGHQDLHREPSYRGRTERASTFGRGRPFRRTLEGWR